LHLGQFAVQSLLQFFELPLQMASVSHLPIDQGLPFGPIALYR